MMVVVYGNTASQQFFLVTAKQRPVWLISDKKWFTIV
jgi:hypothetical protein